MNEHARISRVLRLLHALRSGTPKSILTLCRQLHVSDRSVYRYLTTLKELGYPVESDHHGRFYLPDLPNPTIDADVHGSTLVRTLEQCILASTRVRLIRYHSANSSTVSDRLVEPIGFTHRNRCLVAWEPATQRNNYYRFDRIEAVEPTDQHFERTHRHRIHPPDLFGFNFNGQLIEVNVTLTLRGKLLLEEQYPSVIGLVQGPDESQAYSLTTIVHEASPLVRFAGGLPGDLSVKM